MRLAATNFNVQYQLRLQRPVKNSVRIQSVWISAYMPVLMNRHSMLGTQSLHQAQCGQEYFRVNVAATMRPGVGVVAVEPNTPGLSLRFDVAAQGLGDRAGVVFEHADVRPF